MSSCGRTWFLAGRIVRVPTHRTKAVSLTSSSRWDLVLVGLAAGAILLLLLWPSMDVSLGGDQYVFLARRFAEGSLNVDNLSSRYGDYVVWGAHKYLPFGPLPALLLVPFLPLIDAGMPMVWVGYAFTAVNVCLLYRVLGLAGVTGERRHWATLLYFGGTCYLSVTLVGISTYLAHVVATTFLLLAVWEVLGRRRLPLAGFFLGLAGAARLTAAFGVSFFVWIVWRVSKPDQPTNKVGGAQSPQRRPLAALWPSAMLLSGLAVPVFLLCIYNYARFDSLTETGFGMAVLYHGFLEEARSVGLFSMAHIPKNLFMMLLQGPLPVGGDGAAVLRFPYIEPSRWGMGLFFTSPALLYIFRAHLREPLVQACWLGALSVMVPIVAYYGIGYVQFGYRYALDFMPFLVLLAGRGFPDPMTNRARTLASISVAVNIWGAIVLAIWL